MDLDEKEVLACCGSTKFAREMVLGSPFPSLDHAVSAARDIWFNKVDVSGWLEAFAAHPQIGESPSANTKFASWSKGEQSTALSTASGSILQELADWNVRYRQKFGHIFIIFASGRSSAEILVELKKRYLNRPIVELENAATEQMKITELRLTKLFSTKAAAASTKDPNPTINPMKSGGIIGAHTIASSEPVAAKPSQVLPRTRPPITTHILDLARGSPAAGIDVNLEMWNATQPRPQFGNADTGNWILQGSSTTDKDGRSGQLVKMVDALTPGIYRISFDTGKYCPTGFFPYVSIVFEIRESQKLEHFHVPLLLAPFAFSTYRGS